MELTTAQQTTAFLWSFVLGAAIEIVYFVGSVLRELMSPKRISIFLSDMVFMISVFFANYLYAVAFTEGKVRFYTVFGEMVSFIILYFLMGRTIKCCVGMAFRKIKKMTAAFFYIITKYCQKNLLSDSHRSKKSDFL